MASPPILPRRLLVTRSQAKPSGPGLFGRHSGSCSPRTPFLHLYWLFNSIFMYNEPAGHCWGCQPSLSASSSIANYLQAIKRVAACQIIRPTSCLSAQVLRGRIALRPSWRQASCNDGNALQSLAPSNEGSCLSCQDEAKTQSRLQSIQTRATNHTAATKTHQHFDLNADFTRPSPFLYVAVY
jgi:hypothetical protein